MKQHWETVDLKQISVLKILWHGGSNLTDSWPIIYSWLQKLCLHLQVKTFCLQTFSLLIPTYYSLLIYWSIFGSEQVRILLPITISSQNMRQQMFWWQIIPYMHVIMLELYHLFMFLQGCSISFEWFINSSEMIHY